MTNKPDDIAKKGEEIYARKFKEEYERTHPGEFVAIDINSEQPFLGPTPEDAIKAAQDCTKGSVFHLIRIGAPGVYRVGYYANTGARLN